MMPDTARQYGLQVGATRDERLDVARATRAAARFLRNLYARFRDWPLALAAYNAGPDAVEKALSASGAKTFVELSSGRKLPAETRNYVPAVLAAMRLLGGTNGAAPKGAEAGIVAVVYARMSPAD